MLSSSLPVKALCVEVSYCCVSIRFFSKSLTYNFSTALSLLTFPKPFNLVLCLHSPLSFEYPLSFASPFVTTLSVSTSPILLASASPSPPIPPFPFLQPMTLFPTSKSCTFQSLLSNLSLRSTSSGNLFSGTPAHCCSACLMSVKSLILYLAWTLESGLLNGMVPDWTFVSSAGKKFASGRLFNDCSSVSGLLQLLVKSLL